MNYQGPCSYRLTKIVTDDLSVEVIGKNVPSARFNGATTLYAILVKIIKGMNTFIITVQQGLVVKVSTLYCSIRLFRQERVVG